jgi:PAS domain S-box-containing protein
MKSLDKHGDTLMPSPLLEKRAMEFYQESLGNTHRHTDHLFAYLMVIQWVAGIATALWISPLTWIGTTSAIHWHVWAAIFLGGALTLFPVFVVWKQPGRPLTRHTIAVAQMLWSALLIHLTGGRIETHFHVFGSLAFLAFYRDWRVLVTATVVVAVDHFTRGMFWPQSVFGITTYEPWRWLEHAGWVIFEDIFLCISIRNSLREMFDVALRRARLEGVNVEVERQVAERTAQLTATHEELQSSDQRFRQLAENIHEVFWMTDPVKNQMLYISPAYETIWGRTCESAYKSNLNWREAIHPDDRLHVLEAIATKQARGDYDETYRITRPDGSVRWIQDRAFPVRNEAGQVFRMVGTAEDITKHRRLEDQLRQTQKMEAIGTLAGGIAHDFNNILGAITGYTQLARLSVKNDATACEYLDTVMRAGNRATDLVKQILTFSRQEEQKRQPIQLQKVLAESLTLLRATLPTTIEFRIKLATDVPMVMADTTQVHQIVMNLGTNAWHAMKDRPGHLEIKLENCEVDATMAETHLNLRRGQYARLSFCDTGQGMDRATLERIFEPFFTTKVSGEGTGLGLSVVHGIMQSYGGAITVYSQPGEGTVFHLYFPEYRGGVVPTPVSAEAPIPTGQGQRILYVDDEEDLAQLGKKNLEYLGYVVEVRANVNAALEAVRADPQRFDLVITDQTMPGMTGTDFSKCLLQVRPDLPIILTTGYSANLLPEQIRALGIRDLLQKPHTLQSLGTMVPRTYLPSFDGFPRKSLRATGTESRRAKRASRFTATGRVADEAISHHKPDSQRLGLYIISLLN